MPAVMNFLGEKFKKGKREERRPESSKQEAAYCDSLRFTHPVSGLRYFVFQLSFTGPNSPSR